MVRWTTLRVLNDTSLFDSMQLQVRSVLTCFMRAWAQWASENMRPFPRLIREMQFGLVVARVSIRYEQPFTLFSADEFEVRGHVQVVLERRLVVGEFHFMKGNERFLYAEAVARPVTVAAGGSLGATPTRVEGPILEMFDPEELSDRVPERPVRKVLGKLTSESLIAETRRPIRLHRHDSEAADQWSYIEIGAQAASAREAMVLDAPSSVREKLQRALAMPTQSVDLEINRPLFLFDTAQITTKAYEGPDGLTFVHVYQSQVGGAHDHSTVVERFGACPAR